MTSSRVPHLLHHLPALQQRSLSTLPFLRCTTASARQRSLWLAATVLLGGIFLAGTAREWYQLIYRDGLTIQTNLFGTTFYSLVGLHASHVIVGLIMLSLALIFSLTGSHDQQTHWQD